NAVSRRIIEESVTAADHEVRPQSVGKTEARTEILVIDASNVSMTRIGVHQATLQVGKSRYLKRRRRVRIEIVHMVETLGARQADIVAETQIECQLVGR